LALRFPPTECAGLELPLVIAHAGGAVGGLTYTNSLEALELSYSRGCRFFELDIQWTSDGGLVLLHDWNAAARRIFGEGFGDNWRSRETFLGTPRLDGLTSLDLEGLVSWLEAHPDAVVVTDVKWENLQALARLRSEVPGAERRLIPQIYGFHEYSRVRELGFERIILTLYRSPASDGEVVDFARSVPLVAVTMPLARAFDGLPSLLDEAGVPSLVHTVNSPRNAERLAELGVDGIYTDSLVGCGVNGAALSP
jgi:glycerophosphoryl diester phosphodiesterase